MKPKKEPETFVCFKCGKEFRFEEEPPTPKGLIGYWCGADLEDLTKPRRA